MWPWEECEFLNVWKLVTQSGSADRSKEWRNSAILVVSFWRNFFLCFKYDGYCIFLFLEGIVSTQPPDVQQKQE